MLPRTSLFHKSAWGDGSGRELSAVLIAGHKSIACALAKQIFCCEKSFDSLMNWKSRISLWPYVFIAVSVLGFLYLALRHS